jgi:hypothetical protein
VISIRIDTPEFPDAFKPEAFVDEIDQPKHHRTRFTVAY